jgi:hypothetical protein
MLANVIWARQEEGIFGGFVGEIAVAVACDDIELNDAAFIRNEIKVNALERMNGENLKKLKKRMRKVARECLKKRD